MFFKTKSINNKDIKSFSNILKLKKKYVYILYIFSFGVKFLKRILIFVRSIKKKIQNVHELLKIQKKKKIPKAKHLKFKAFI